MTPDFGSAVDPAMESDFLKDLYNTARYVRFGPFQIDQNRQQVFRHGVRLRLQGKVYQVLIVLLHKQGEVVTREELKQALWPADTHVNYDANVNTTVNKLRQALGDSSEQPLYIETIPRKGYCLVVQPEFTDLPVTPLVVHGAGPALSTQAAKTGAPRPSSDVWITIGVIALILTGMLLGAGITRLWIAHFAPGAGGFSL